MKRKLLSCVLIVFITTSFVLLLGCNNKKEQYKLQEQCGKQSEEWFKKKYDQKEFQYINHYNTKLNKCFIFVSFDNIEDGNPNSDILYTGKILFDVNENKEYGICVRDQKNNKISKCDFLGKKCKSSEEWELLVKPYMEE